ncbi:MAG: type II secretory pathway protein LspK [uncultured bacterium]|nr:MAG: type II secretory pathway protein LspK [uncultured bacterium]
MLMHRKNRGGALISALFITAICAMMAVALIMRERLLIHEGELIMRSDQAYLNLEVVSDWAIASLEEFTISVASGHPKSLQTVFPTVKLDDMKIEGMIVDAQSKFNLNDLKFSANQPRFIALLRAVDPNVLPDVASGVAESITAWMTTGAQNRYYLSLNPPYRSSYAKLANVSELRLIAGVTPEIYNALLPYVVALPLRAAVAAVSVSSTSSEPQTPININTASAPVLLTVNPSMGLSQAENLIACRKQSGGFVNTQDFINNCVQPAHLSPTAFSGITTLSSFYLVYSEAEIKNTLVQLTSLLVTRVDNNNKLNVLVEWQALH